ncbi:hypothetical protein C1645_817326 [Glomus cerebriforme]|uniref:Uncharacterized protein n=1 Tax=Glomus cerebriforme TaxID=658196 RepID=A0A397T9M0_9GLOM|nr:hypothetical protein C1645_817326 [Glomus cerebriforme]
MITNNEWDLITDLTEVLSTFVKITEELGKIKIRLYNNMKKYYPILTTESFIPLILDSQFKNLDFITKNQQFNTKQHLSKLFEQKKEKYQREIETSDLLNQSQSKLATRKKNL